MSLIDNVLKMANDDPNFRGTQIVAYMIGYIKGLEGSSGEDVNSVKNLTKLIREVNIFDTLKE